MAERLRFGRLELAVREDLTPADEFRVPAFDEQYYLDPVRLEDLAAAVQVRIPAFLCGPPGSGKTSVVLQLAALLNQPAVRVNLGGQPHVADLLGEKALTVEPASGQAVTEWRDGPVTEAVRRGWWLILDEYTAMPPSVTLRLQGLLEVGGSLVLAENGGEVVEPHPSFRLFATDNTTGRGDDTGLYQGTQAQNDANLDRFVVFACDYPPPAEEAAILVRKTGIPAKVARMMVEVATLVRSGMQKSETFCTLGTRRLLAWASFAAAYANGHAYTAPAARAYRVAVRSKLGAEDAAYVDGVAKRVGFDL
jgi:cobaltochelatase CobS